MKAVFEHKFTFSWVAKLQVVEHMTRNICSTSAEDASICQLHHIQSPSYFVQVVLVVYVTNLNKCELPLVTVNNLILQFTKFLHSIITYFKTQFKTNIHGLNYSRILFVT